MKESDNHEVKIEEKQDRIFSVLTGITAVAGVAVVFLFFYRAFGHVLVGALTIAYITGFFMKPLITIIRESKDRLISLQEKLFLGLRALLILIGIQSAYMIFASPEYNLYWNYWIFVGILLLLAWITGRENKKRKTDSEEEVEEEELRGFKKLKKFKRVGGFLLSAIVALSNFYSLYTPKKIIALEDLALPNYISMEERDEVEATYGSTAYLFQHRETITIDDEETLQKLIDSLEGKTLENIRYIEELNYMKMKGIESPYYRGYTHYEGAGSLKQACNGEKTSYIYGLEIYPNGRVYLIMYTGGRRRWTENFQVELDYKIIETLLQEAITLK
ncbi:hypothetical protein [Natronincola ferrireducens]|uniref:Uncharacterized protein n=1 Tax=Natronincola ferrireducens TaxID=393762 RepID=A0A1G9FTW8_9FIRM|nr:hypothetical protein [Natronincola ferrireducens]SDK91775.1 hypothetical protein SAMN05660472_02246 [Natronincola ferrireducens]